MSCGCRSGWRRATSAVTRKAKSRRATGPAVPKPFAERALDILERYAPGTRDKILGRRIVTPADLESDNPNLVGGDQVCGSHHITRNFLFRPVLGHADGSTPMKNLVPDRGSRLAGCGHRAGSGFLLAKALAGK